MSAASTVAKMLGVIVGIVTTLNLAFVLAGFVVVPLIIKIVSGVVGLYLQFSFIASTVKKIYKEIKKMKAGECDLECKETLVEKSSAVLGAITEVILSGRIVKLEKVEGLGFKVKRSKKLLRIISNN